MILLYHRIFCIMVHMNSEVLIWFVLQRSRWKDRTFIYCFFFKHQHIKRKWVKKTRRVKPVCVCEQRKLLGFFIGNLKWQSFTQVPWPITQTEEEKTNGETDTRYNIHSFGFGTHLCFGPFVAFAIDVSILDAFSLSRRITKDILC